MKRRKEGQALGRAPIRDSFGLKNRKRFLVAYGRGLTVEAAAHEVGVSSVTVFKHVRKNPKFKAKFLRARELSIDVLEDLLHQHARSGNITAIFGMLRARRPEVWRENQKVDITSGGKPLDLLASALVSAAQSRERELSRPESDAPIQH